MAISSNDNEIFDLSNIQDNDILVYDASTGTFRNEASAVSANATITGQYTNTSVSLINISDHLIKDTSAIDLPLQNYNEPTHVHFNNNYIPKYSNLIHHIDFINYNLTNVIFILSLTNTLYPIFNKIISINC